MRCATCVTAFLILVACEPPASTYRDPLPERYSHLNASPRPMPRRAPSSVALYRTQKPEQRYVEVFEMVDVGDDETEALETLKHSAGAMGCDGLIVGPARVEVGGLWRIPHEVNVAGTCIMFQSDPRTWRAPPSEAPAAETPAVEPDGADGASNETCAQERKRLLATEDPRERAAIARAMPPECHRR